MKKFRKTIKTIRDLITILGIPAIGILGWKMHQEQMNLKDYTIASKQAEIEFLERTRSSTILDAYEKEKSFFEQRHKKMTDSIKSFESIIDSLEKRYNVRFSDEVSFGWEGHPDSIRKFFEVGGRLRDEYAKSSQSDFKPLSSLEIYVLSLKNLNRQFSKSNEAIEVKWMDNNSPNTETGDDSKIKDRRN